MNKAISLALAFAMAFQTPLMGYANTSGDTQEVTAAVSTDTETPSTEDTSFSAILKNKDLQKEQEEAQTQESASSEASGKASESEKIEPFCSIEEINEAKVNKLPENSSELPEDIKTFGEEFSEKLETFRKLQVAELGKIYGGSREPIISLEEMTSWSTQISEFNKELTENLKRFSKLSRTVASKLITEYLKLVHTYELIWLVNQPTPLRISHSMALETPRSTIYRLFPTPAMVPNMAEIRPKEAEVYEIKLHPVYSFKNWQIALGTKKSWDIPKRHLELMKCTLSTHYIENTTNIGTLLKNDNPLAGVALNQSLCQGYTVGEVYELYNPLVSELEKHRKKVELVKSWPTLSVEDGDLAELPKDTEMDTLVRASFRYLYDKDPSLRHQLPFATDSDVSSFINKASMYKYLDSIKEEFTGLKELFASKLEKIQSEMPLSKMGESLVNDPQIKDGILKLTYGCGVPVIGIQVVDELSPNEGLKRIAKWADILFIESLQEAYFHSYTIGTSSDDLVTFLAQQRVYSILYAAKKVLDYGSSPLLNPDPKKSLGVLSDLIYDRTQELVQTEAQKEAENIANYFNQLNDLNNKKEETQTKENPTNKFYNSAHETAIRAYSELSTEEGKGHHEAGLDFDFAAWKKVIEGEVSSLPGDLASEIREIEKLHSTGQHRDYWRIVKVQFDRLKIANDVAKCEPSTGRSFLAYFSDSHEAKNNVVLQCRSLERIAAVYQLNAEKDPKTISPVIDDLAGLYSEDQINELIRAYRFELAAKTLDEYRFITPDLLEKLVNNPNIGSQEAYDDIENELRSSLKISLDRLEEVLGYDDLNDFHVDIVRSNLINNLLGELRLKFIQKELSEGIKERKRLYSYFTLNLVVPDVVEYHQVLQEKWIRESYLDQEIRDGIKQDIIWVALGGLIPGAASWIFRPFAATSYLAGLSWKAYSKSQWIVYSYGAVAWLSFVGSLADNIQRAWAGNVEKDWLEDSYRVTPLFNKESPLPVITRDEFSRQVEDLKERISSAYWGIGIDALVIAMPFIFNRGIMPKVEGWLSKKAVDNAHKINTLTPEEALKLENELISGMAKHLRSRRGHLKTLKIDPTDAHAWNIDTLTAARAELLAKHASDPVRRMAVEHAYNDMIMFVARNIQRLHGVPSMHRVLARQIMGPNGQVRDLQRYYDAANEIMGKRILQW